MWATRKRPWIDRLASAWLISRHIDPKAQFVWLEKPEDCRPYMLGFDFNGAAFTHVGRRVTFETLLESFGLDGDPALRRMAAIVHYRMPAVSPTPMRLVCRPFSPGPVPRPRRTTNCWPKRFKVFDMLYASYQPRMP
ncbi:MAG: chromate resistance protein [Betaproteobacteria bacterium]|nr:chromate resistance protein [Betaproteobacteria bacterium]